MGTKTLPFKRLNYYEKRLPPPQAGLKSASSASESHMETGLLST